MEYKDYWDFATESEKFLANRYPMTLEQAVVILTLAEQDMDLAEKAGQLMMDGVPYIKVRMKLYKKEIR